MAINTQATFGSIPQHHQPVEGPGIKALFHSLREQALILDKTVRGGFGIVKGGTVMSMDASGYLFPYPGTDHLDTANQARAFALADVADTESAINVLKADAAKFVVGEDIMLVRNNAASPDVHDGGAIVSVDITTNPNFAVITFTTAVSGAVWTVANSLNCYPKADTVESDGIAAHSINDQDVDTGDDENALGALTSIVLSNAILYESAFVNLDSDALTDLGATSDGRYVILK